MTDDKPIKHNALIKKLYYIVPIAFVVLYFIFNSILIVPAGRVEVASLFGNVKNQIYTNGFHIVNPFYSFTEYDVRNKSAFYSQVPVPTADQLTSKMDVRIQYRIIAADTPSILQNTGKAEDLVKVKLNPEVYSELRDSTKTISQAEQFFQSSVQVQLQDSMLAALKASLTPIGIDVQDVLISDIQLPQYIVDAIHAKKVREQQVQQEKAELQRIQIQSQQQVAQAQAAYEASEQQAKGIRVLADAQAYKIKTITASLGSPENYIHLQAIQAMTDMAKDPATKFYFMNASSTQPFPFLNIGNKTNKVIK